MHQDISVDQIGQFGSNHQRKPDAGLIDSVRVNGVLQAITVRPTPAGSRDKGGPYQLVYGHRRLAAARAVGLKTIPADVRELDDAAMLEMRLVENVQRADLHPLDEAEEMRLLLRQPGYDVAKLAARICRSTKYVYDRMRLLALNKEAQAAFREGLFTPGHAILLARLSEKDQARAMEVPKYDEGGLFRDEDTLFTDRNPGQRPQFALRSVREFTAWIDENVRLDLASEDLSELFPETAKALEKAEDPAHVVSIAHDEHLPKELAKSGAILPAGKWKRADGSKGARSCSSALIGVVVIGEGRGETFKVCIDKHCKTHWGAEQRAKARQERATARGEGAEEETRRKAREQAERAHREALAARWKKAGPDMIAAVAAFVATAKATPKAPLGAYLSKTTAYWNAADAAKHVPLGKTAEDLVRALAFRVMLREMRGYQAETSFPKLAKSLGCDLTAVLKKHGPTTLPTALEKKPAAPARTKRRKAKRA